MSHFMKLFIDNLWISPYTYSVYCALKEKEVLFELEEVSFQSGHGSTQTFRDRSYTDLIPLIDDDGFMLSESMAILEYAEEKFPAPKVKPIFPEAVQDRARARMLMSWYRTGLQTLRNERSAETIFYSEERSNCLPLSAVAQEEIQDWTRFLSDTLRHGKPFLFGNWSIADTETAFMLHRMICNGDPVDEKLKKYATAIWNRPATREYVEHQRPQYRSFYAP